MSKFNSRITTRERGLIKGALRRVFSRSELRRAVLAKALIQHSDPNRPRVTKWGVCTSCGVVTPAYLLQVDHVQPCIPIESSFEEMGADDLIDALWCDPSNLVPICKDCHKLKTSSETKARRKIKKSKQTK